MSGTLIGHLGDGIALHSEPGFKGNEREYRSPGDVIRLLGVSSVPTFAAGQVHRVQTEIKHSWVGVELGPDYGKRYFGRDQYVILSEPTFEECEAIMASNQKIRVGNTVRLNRLFQERNPGWFPKIGEGSIGEVAAMDGAIPICKMDGHGDSIVVQLEELDIIDSDFEQKHKYAAKAQQEKIHPGKPHEWLHKWEKTYKECSVPGCGVTAWNLACWTGSSWHYKTPRGILVERPDLPRPKGFLEPVTPVPLPPPITFRARSMDIINDEALRTPITVIGAGAIGSFTVMALAKMGYQHIHVIDDDVCAVENGGTQLYSNAWAGTAKVSALQILMAHVGGEETWHLEREQIRYRNRVFTQGIVILAVDNMTTRRACWDAHAAAAQKTTHVANWIIDPRMGAEQAQIYTMSPKSAVDRDTHPKSLYSDEDAVQEPCTAAGTVYTAMLVAGQIAKNVKDITMRTENYARTVFWNIAENAPKFFLQNREEKSGEIMQALSRRRRIDYETRVMGDFQSADHALDAARYIVNIPPESTLSPPPPRPTTGRSGIFDETPTLT